MQQRYNSTGFQLGQKGVQRCEEEHGGATNLFRISRFPDSFDFLDLRLSDFGVVDDQNFDGILLIQFVLIDTNYDFCNFSLEKGVLRALSVMCCTFYTRTNQRESDLNRCRSWLAF